MRTQRWTLAVVCVATAMLMLDIAVVNTALSDIADDLDTGLSGLQWVVDAYTLALAATVLTAGSLADRFGRRRLFTHRPGAVHRRVAAVRGGRRHRDAQRRPRRAGRRRRGHVRGLAGAARQRVPATPRSASSALAAYGATIGASFAVGPLVGGALTSGLGWRWIFLVNLPLGLAVPVRSPARYVAESRGPDARARVDRRRPADAHRRAVPARPRAAARQRGRLGQRGDRRRARRRGRRCSCAFVAIEGRVARADAPAAAVPQPRVRRRAGRRVRDLRVVLRRVPLHRRSTCSRCSACRRSRPASSTCPARCSCSSSPGATAPARRAGLRRGRWSRVGLALVAVGMALLTSPASDSSWTALLPGLLVAMIGTGLFNPAVSAVALGLGAAGAERPRRGRQRHVPPGRHRGRRRRARRARSRPAPRSAAAPAGLRRRPARRAVGRRRAVRRGRRRLLRAAASAGGTPPRRARSRARLSEAGRSGPDCDRVEGRRSGPGRPT